MEQQEKYKSTEKTRNSKILITNKSITNLCGVNKVFSATENCISLSLAGENMLFSGSNLHIIKLDIEAGVVDFEGTIFNIKFGGGKQDKNFLKRFFS